MKIMSFTPKLLQIEIKLLKNNISLQEIKNDKMEKNEFGTVYTEFKNKPKEAIKHLLKVQEGECINALYREDIGYIDIVWGENDKNNKGYGLKHIYEKHGHEIKELGFNIEDFIPIIAKLGNLVKAKETTKNFT